MFKLTNALLTGTGVACIAMAGGTFYLIVAAQQFSIAQQAGSVLQTYYGFFGELSLNGEPRVTPETLHLRFSAEHREVVGETTVRMDQNGKKFNRNWKINGYFRDPKLVFNIYTVHSDHDPKAPTGIGTMYLTKTESDAYTGTTLYLDCDLKKVLRCPYALTSTEMTPKQAETKWPGLFAHENKCAPVDLTPTLKDAALVC